MVELIAQGLTAALDPYVLALLAGSVCLGILAGALPGISATMGVAVLAPLTFTLDPYPAIVSLLGIYCGAVYGGSISAIVLGIPGTPGAVATTLDGSLMARRGAAGRALGSRPSRRSWVARSAPWHWHSCPTRWRRSR